MHCREKIFTKGGYLTPRRTTELVQYQAAQLHEPIFGAKYSGTSVFSLAE